MNQFKNALQRILNLIVPPLLNPLYLITKIKNKKIIKNKFEFENNLYNRTSFITKCLTRFNFDNAKYLEIGVCANDVFNAIPLKISNKIGVDPQRGGTHRMTSDSFFENNKEMFDVIFIDGLHLYGQCQKDCINSLKFLKDDGFIIFHDFLPRNAYEENVPPKQKEWSGDIWKVAVEINNSLNKDFIIVNIDRGVGILKPQKDFKYKFMSNLKNMDFDDFYKSYYSELPIVNCNEAFKFIEKK